MNLVILTAFIAVCGAAKLDRTYLPPPSANTAGGNPDSLQTPLIKSSSVQGDSSVLPTGSYTNDFQGVVVEADSAGTRASLDGSQSGLGGPRDNYGSTNSKVGDAAFRGSLTGFQNTQTFGNSALNGQASEVNAGQNFGAFESKSERPQAFKDRNSNIISYANDVSSDNYSYGFESDNGIAVGVNGVVNNGIQAQGGYSYKGDDGKIYKVTYIADEGGYRAQGAHLPTPPPIPKEILESLEKNAKDEAAGLVDDGDDSVEDSSTLDLEYSGSQGQLPENTGSYDAQKYNAEGDYTHYNGDNVQYNDAQSSQFSKRPESDATASSTFINQNNQAIEKPENLGNTGVSNTIPTLNDQSSSYNANKFGVNSANNQNNFAGVEQIQSSQTSNEYQQSSSFGMNSPNQFGQSSSSTFQLSQTQPQTTSYNSQLDYQSNQQAPNNIPHGQTVQFSNQQSLSTQIGGVESTDKNGFQNVKPTLIHNSSTPSFNLGTNFGNAPFKPISSYNSASSSQNSFGIPQNDYNTQEYSQTIQKQGSNQAASSNINLNKPSFSAQTQNQPVTTSFDYNGGQFPNQPNHFGAQYLPPIGFNDIQSSKIPQNNHTFHESNIDDTISQTASINGQNAGGQDLKKPADYFVGFDVYKSETDLSTNFQTQINQFPHNNNNQLHYQKQNQFDLPTTYQQANGALPSNSFGLKPTVVPNNELTTPLEPNEKPFIASQFNSVSISNFNKVTPQPLNNEIQKQNNNQSNIVVHQLTESQDSSTVPQSRPQTAQQEITPNFQTAPTNSQGLALNLNKPQFSQNTFSSSQQNNAYYSTQKPQKFDNSYYYNQPSKPFRIPVTRPQAATTQSSSYNQVNGMISNNEHSNQFNSLPMPSQSSLLDSAVPTSFSQNVKSQDVPTINYYNGITQASISHFPSTSPALTPQHDSAQSTQFEFKHSENQSPIVQSHQNRPIFSQQHSNHLSSSSKAAQDQVQLGETSNNNYGVQSQPLKPISTFNQSPTNTINQNQIQQQNLIANNKQQQISDIIQNQQISSTSSQQYQGTIYEYNKPEEVLPASQQTDNFSEQNISDNDTLKPQENQESNFQAGLQQTQNGQYQFSSQLQAFNTSQDTKPQLGLQFFQQSDSPLLNQPFVRQNTQSTFSQNVYQYNVPQRNEQSIKSNDSSLIGKIQIQGQSKPQYNSQSVKPFDNVPNVSLDAKKFQQPQRFPNREQSFQSFNGAQSVSTTQFDQFTPNIIKNETSPYSTSQISGQSNKPFRGTTTYNSDSSKPQEPLGHNGYPSSKPQFGNQLTYPQIQAVMSNPTTHVNPTSLATQGSIDSHKSKFEQNKQSNHGNQPTFGHQFVHTQFGSKPFPSSSSSQAHFSQNSGQVTGSTVSQQQPQIQAYQPLDSSNQGSYFQSQDKTQFDQSSQIATSQSNSGVEPLKPFSFNTQGTINKQQNIPNTPFNNQKDSPCCQSSKDSSIAPLNVGKPSQAFAQTQSQFAGFQGAQSISAQTVAGKGEEFGGPRQPPSFDAQTGYHY